MAATAKNNKIESLVKTIGKLTTTNLSLTATIKKLTSQLERSQSKIGRTEHNGASGGGTSGGGASGEGRWPHWCNPDAYCFTCGYKLRRGHDSTNCHIVRGNPNHKKEATRQNTMGGSTSNAGFGNTPNGK